MFIDTHCHLFSDYYEDMDNVVKKYLDSGVTKVIVSGTDMRANIEVLKLVDKYDSVYGTIGFHPTELDGFEESCYSWLEENINNKKIVAIGEIGLDYHYDNTDRELQKRIFKKQLEIAEKYNKPVVIHTRDAIQETYDILKEYNLVGSIHCYSGSIEMAKEFIKLGYKIGIGGVVTYKNAKNIKEVVKNIDLSYILLETDSPYLTPEPNRGSKNDPSYIPLIVDKIAEIKDTSILDVARVTTDSAECLFDFFKK